MSNSRILRQTAIDYLIAGDMRSAAKLILIMEPAEVIILLGEYIDYKDEDAKHIEAVGLIYDLALSVSKEK